MTMVRLSSFDVLTVLILAIWLPCRGYALEDKIARITANVLLQKDANGTVVQLFQWRWTDVARECCEFLGPHGVDAVQISPPMEQITAPQWWSSYQPVSYKLGNRLGDEQGLASMVKTCSKCGVKIIADAVTNHMASGAGTGSSGSSFGGRGFPGTYSPPDFHHHPGDLTTNCQITDYTDRENVQLCDLVGLPDLDSSADWPRHRLGAYLGSLGALGVAGFRVDAAKHQDAHALGQILSANVSAAGLEVYQEVIGASGEAVKPSEYIGNGRVTEFALSYRLSAAVRSGDFASMPQIAEASDLLPSDSALSFIDNHDSQRSAHALNANTSAQMLHPQGARGISRNASRAFASVLTYRDGELYAIAAAFLLAWPYGRVRLMSSYYFDDHDQGPPATPVYGGSGSAHPSCGDGHPWVCEHRWAAIAGMVRWRRVAGDAKVTHLVSDGSGRLAFARGAKAFIALANPSAGTWQAQLQTGLPPGTYCDVASGAGGFGPPGAPCAHNVTVSPEGMVSLAVGDSGVHVIAIHVGAVVVRL